MGRIRKGQSVAVNGVCLTLTGMRAGAMVFDVIPETLRVTTLGSLKAGDTVNLERAMKADARLDGHLVQGHVEAVGRVSRVEDGKRGLEFTVSFPARLSPRILKKGCIAMDGISLTVARASKNRFTVCVIPHTLKSTNLKELSAGGRVNLETDVLLRRRGKR